MNKTKIIWKSILTIANQNEQHSFNKKSLSFHFMFCVGFIWMCISMIIYKHYGALIVATEFQWNLCNIMECTNGAYKNILSSGVIQMG